MNSKSRPLPLPLKTCLPIPYCLGVVGVDAEVRVLSDGDGSSSSTSSSFWWSEGSSEVVAKAEVVGEWKISKSERMVAADSGLLGFAFVLGSRQVAGDREDAGTNVGGGDFNLLGKLLVFEDEDSLCDTTRGFLVTIGVIAVEVGSTDTGGSGKGREGGGEIGGNDNGGGVYEKKVIDNCTLIKIYI